MSDRLLMNELYKINFNIVSPFAQGLLYYSCYKQDISVVDPIFNIYHS
jgi:hypothetical protein